MALNLGSVNWLDILRLAPLAQEQYAALLAAQDVDAKAKAVGDLAITGVKIAEAFVSKDLVNDAEFVSLVGHVLEAIADAQDLKPEAPSV